jgi:hypothetical protein
LCPPMVNLEGNKTPATPPIPLTKELTEPIKAFSIYLSMSN